MKNLIRLTFAAVMITSASIAANASGWSCTVSSNANNNIGHCRALIDGGDECFKTGEGPACNGDIYQEQEQL